MKNIVCLVALALAVSFAANAVAEEKQNAAPAEKGTVVSVRPGADCPCVNPCQPCGPYYYPPVAYRVGLFGHLRPVVYAPAYRPYYYPYHYPYYRGYYPPAYAW
ncbi:MAG: hypothetical protein LBT89_00225 [Planctomycetaceae bacterium]|nr:hypothetical protein [Planctomycetaceae bacterium]